MKFGGRNTIQFVTVDGGWRGVGMEEERERKGWGEGKREGGEGLGWTDFRGAMCTPSG